MMSEKGRENIRKGAIKRWSKVPKSNLEFKNFKVRKEVHDMMEKQKLTGETWSDFFVRKLGKKQVNVKK